MSRRLTLSLFAVLLATGIAGTVHAQYKQMPDWISIAGGKYSTGLGIADIDGDGWEDIVVANGNDMARQHVEVYLNKGDGSFPRTPSWQSGDIAYHGHLSLGDINRDGWIDCAVSEFIGENGFDLPGCVKVYFNQQGTLESLPSWRSADSIYSFSCALGDADGDGDLDLAVAEGQPYPDSFGNPKKGPGRIYFNSGNALSASPGWKSDSSLCAMDIEWADIDKDGNLDLLFACTWTPHVVFYGTNYGMKKSYSLIGNASEWFGNSIAVGNLDNDTNPDIVISENNQLGGDGRCRGYKNDGASVPAFAEFWRASKSSYGSAVTIAGIDTTAGADILLGYWWGPVELYPHGEAGYSAEPAWKSNTNSVIEAFALADLRHKSLKQISQGIIPFSGTIFKTLYQVGYENNPPQQILSVKINGVPLTHGVDYITAPGASWISCPACSPLRTTDVLEILFSYSDRNDLVVSNWDPNIGNFLFYNQFAVPPVERVPAASPFAVSVYPNPASGTITFTASNPEAAGQGDIAIYNELGMLISRQSFYQGIAQWDGTDSTGVQVPAGMYRYIARSGDAFSHGTVCIIR